MTGGALTLQRISKRFGNERVLRSLDLVVREGEMVAILGESGCGKSTTLKVISGLLKQDRGSVMLGGECIDPVPVHRRRMGFVFQNYSLFPFMNVESNIQFGMCGMGNKEKDQRTGELLTLVGLEGFQKRMPKNLSGGQKQRVALARALAIEPSVLLLDEPFGALDTTIRRRLRRDLRDLQKRIGVTTLFVTHDQEEAFEIGDRIALMNRGRIEQIGRPRDLYEKPGTPFVAGFIGSSNVICLKDPKWRRCRNVLIRPEDIVLNPALSSKEGVKGVKGTLINYFYLGHVIEVLVLLENGDTLKVLMNMKEFKRKGLKRGQDVLVKIIKFSILER